MATITPVLLAGGSGTRLWPLSRKSYPKQFSRLMGEETLFQASAKRLRGGTNGMKFAAPVVLTNADFRFIVTEQLSAAGIDPGAVLIEPEGRNTGPAVLAAALHVMAGDSDALLLVAPSDHVVPDSEAFHAAIAKGHAAATTGKLVTFGVTPDRAEAGYGYLQLADPPDGTGAAIALSSFVEKPDIKTAEQMLDDETYLWNSGIFLFAARDIVSAYQQLAADLVDPVEQALANAKVDLGFLRLAAEPWARAQDISIDYAVMERASNLVVVPYTGFWSDLGGWDAVWRENRPGPDGVVTGGTATAIDCENSLLRAESSSQQLVGIGLSDIIAIAMPDAVLVADKNRAQDVKLAVKALSEKGVAQAQQFPRDHRPWGFFESLITGDRFQVKRIVVHPGAALSLQSHYHRSEHWIVVEGTAKVTIDDDVRLVSENQSVYIPVGAVHRMENPGKMNMVLIEVQTGSYVGEDDIVRYDDVYARD